MVFLFKQYYHLFNQIFQNKNIKLKNLFKNFHKANNILFFIILNFITNLILLSIFDIQLNNTLNINVNIYLAIIKNLFFYY